MIIGGPGVPELMVTASVCTPVRCLGCRIINIGCDCHWEKGAISSRHSEMDDADEKNNISDVAADVDISLIGSLSTASWALVAVLALGALLLLRDWHRLARRRQRACCVPLRVDREDLISLKSQEVDPAAQIVTVVIDLITDKKHIHFVKAVDDLNPNSGSDKYGLEAAWECMGDDHDGIPGQAPNQESAQLATSLAARRDLPSCRNTCDPDVHDPLGTPCPAHPQQT